MAKSRYIAPEPPEWEHEDIYAQADEIANSGPGLDAIADEGARLGGVPADIDQLETWGDKPPMNESAKKIETYLNKYGDLNPEWISAAAFDIATFCEGLGKDDAMTVLNACIAAYPLSADETLQENGRLLLLDTPADAWTKVKQYSRAGVSLDYVDIPPMIRRLDVVLGKANWSMVTDSSDSVVIATVRFRTRDGRAKEVSGASGFTLAPIPSLESVSALLDFGGKMNELLKEYGKIINAINEYNQNVVKEAETDAQKRALAKAGLTLYLWEKQ